MSDMPLSGHAVVKNSQSWEFEAPIAKAPHLKVLQPQRPQSSPNQHPAVFRERPAGGRRLVEAAADGKRQLNTASLHDPTSLSVEAFKDECMSILRDEAVAKRGPRNTQIWGDLVSAMQQQKIPAQAWV